MFITSAASFCRLKMFGWIPGMRNPSHLFRMPIVITSHRIRRSSFRNARLVWCGRALRAIARKSFCLLANPRKFAASTSPFFQPVISLDQHNFSYARKMDPCFIPAISSFARGSRPSRRNGPPPTPLSWRRPMACHGIGCPRPMKSSHKSSHFVARPSRAEKSLSCLDIRWERHRRFCVRSMVPALRLCCTDRFTR